ncbi:MAG: hypothetical protein EXS35_14265 [Pedosphaera sp.]|nr:hypothetical protein [Pedosphaera sp.]
MNRRGARYLVVVGFAIIEAGYLRLTTDIDLLVDTSLENESRVFAALRTLPDQAVNELDPGDIDRFTVVRVADEILVDLMKSGCGLDYAEASKDAVIREVNGVSIPFASPQTLWRMKQTHREKDIPDRLFLRQLLEAQGIRVEESRGPKTEGLRAWLTRLFGGSD